MMPEWLGGGLVGIGVAVIGAAGLLGGHAITSRAQKRTTEVQAAAAAKSNEQQLIDQLQEELAGYRTAADTRATTQDQRMERIEQHNLEITEERDTLRDYAHDLRGHIFNNNPPPPPEWPSGVKK